MFASVPTQQPWFWEVTDTVIALSVLLYLLLIGVLLSRRLYLAGRLRRERSTRTTLQLLLERLERGERGADLSRQVAKLDEIERPIGAELLLEHLDAADDENRVRLSAALEQIGATRVMERGLRRTMPWRKALAARTLGRFRVAAAVPALTDALNDRSQRVRDEAALALGAIGDPSALAAIRELSGRGRRQVSSGVVVEALLGMPASATGPVFVEGLGSPSERVRAASCHGVALAVDREEAETLIAGVLSDDAEAVRAAACTALARIGGARVPARLAAAVSDPAPIVRREAVRALAVYDSTDAVALSLAALDDPDREVAARAGVTLVQLSREPHARADARQAVVESTLWPVQRAVVLAEVGGL